jgi:hypothetical protein
MELKDKTLNMRITEDFGGKALEVSLALGEQTGAYWPMTAVIEFSLSLSHALLKTSQLQNALMFPGVREQLDKNLGDITDKRRSFV